MRQAEAGRSRAGSGGHGGRVTHARPMAAGGDEGVTGENGGQRRAQQGHPEARAVGRGGQKPSTERHGRRAETRGVVRDGGAGAD